MRFKLPKSISNYQLFKNNDELDDEDEVDDENENSKDASTKKFTTLAAILSKAPPKFPWLFPQSINGNLPKNIVKNDQNDQQLASSKEEEKTEKEKIRDQKKTKKIAKKNKKLEKEIRKRMIEAKKWRDAEFDNENREIPTKKQKKRKREKDEEEKKSTERVDKPKKAKRKHKRKRSQNRSSSSIRNSRKETLSRSRQRNHSTRHSLRSSSSRSRTRHKQRNRSKSSERTYSSISPPPSRRRTRSRSYSPLPPFSRQRAMQTRRRLIEESWHRRIKHSVRPIDNISSIRPSTSVKEKPIDKSDYEDSQGKIDKQKLLDIATKNATKLAMEGKLPKGAELIETIKNKSVEHLINLCKNLQTERDLLPKGSSSDEDEEKKYSKKYDDWRERRDRSKDREFRNRGVMPADHPSRQKYMERDRREIRKREDTTLRLTFPVSSGAIHRTKANESIMEMASGPLVKYGEIGPLTTALAKVRTSIPAAYRPLSQPLPNALPSSVLATHFQNTSTISIEPQIPERQPTPENKPSPPDIVNSKAYEIALAALERTAELEKEKTKEPILATSSNFIGPMITPIDLIAASTIGSNVESSITSAQTITNQSSSNVTATNVPAKMLENRPHVYTSTWDKPGHIAAREAFLKKIAEQKRPADEATAKTKLENAKKGEEAQQPNEKQQSGIMANRTLEETTEKATKMPSSMLIEKEEKNDNGTTLIKEKSSSPTKSILSSKISSNIFVPSAAPLLLPTTSNPLKDPLKIENAEMKRNAENNDQLDLIDKMHAYVESQVARQKAESMLHATILSTQIYQKTPANMPKNELSTFSTSRSKDPIGLTAPSKSIQELVSTRLRYNQRLQRNPNDFETRKELAKVEEELSKWAYDSTLPGEFTGHTGARVLSEKELEPNDPRFHAWARKDQFRNVPEISSGVGMRLMEKMGWKPGQGLGKNAAGPIEPLALDVKSDRKGFYSEDYERVPKRESVVDPSGKNPISVLMEVCARQHWEQPQFHCIESGPQNYKKFHWKAILNGVEYSPTLASSNKRAGKAQVCMVILDALGITS